jgi:hypothetical protein
MLTLTIIAVALFSALLLLKLGAKMFFRAAGAQYEKRRALEHENAEVADWIGRTGLDEATERELPRYLRRELGEFLDEPGGLKASDLIYLGLLSDERGAAHFWKMPEKDSIQSFAYVDVGNDGEALGLGWGDRKAPSEQKSA